MGALCSQDRVFENAEWRVTCGPRAVDKPGETRPRVKLHYKLKRRALFAFGSSHSVELVQVQLPALLYPTNGYILRSQVEINQALELVHAALDSVAERGAPLTDIRRLDLVLNLPIDPGVVMNAFAYARIPFVRKIPELFQEVADIDSAFMSSPTQTLQWMGKETWLSFYNKTRKTCKDSGAAYHPGNLCLRIELRLIGKKRIARFLGDHSQHPRAIASLDFFDLYHRLRAVLCKLPGMAYCSEPLNLMNLMAACQAGGFQPFGIPVLDWYAQDVSGETFRKTQKLVSGLVPSMLGFSFDAILPALAPPEQVDVHSDGSTRLVFDPSWGQHLRIVRGPQGFGLAPVRDTSTDGIFPAVLGQV